MYDANLVLAANTTVTSTGVATTTYGTLSLRNPTYGGTTSNPGGTPRYGLKARVNIPTLLPAAGTMDFTIEHSDDSSNWALCAAPQGWQGTASVPTAQVTAGNTQLFIPVTTDKPYVRLLSKQGGTITLSVVNAQLGLGYP